MYYVDSAPGTIHTFDVDERGDISNKQLLVQFDVGRNEHPDGLCVDSDGALWVAVWGGFEVRQFSPRGEQLSRVILDTAQPSSCAIGGANATTLYITTARENMSGESLDVQPNAGRLFCVDVQVQGQAIEAYRSTVGATT
jgi:sugar lactone lactonase YvrE